MGWPEAILWCVVVASVLHVIVTHIIIGYLRGRELTRLEAEERKRLDEDVAEGKRPPPGVAWWYRTRSGDEYRSPKPKSKSNG